MRPPRYKPANTGTEFHIFNRTTGLPHESILDKDDKKVAHTILLRFGKLFKVNVSMVQLMDSHYHMLVYSSHRRINAKQTARRYNRYKRREAARQGKKFTDPMVPGDERCREWQDRLSDISCFIARFQKAMADYYNARHEPRKGALWGQRFKSVPVQDGHAFLRCFMYIAMNPQRAGIEPDGFLTYPHSTCTRAATNPDSAFARGMLPRLCMHASACGAKFTETEMFALVVDAAKAMRERDAIEAARKRGEDVSHRNMPKIPLLLRPDWNNIEWENVLIFGDLDFIRKVRDEQAPGRPLHEKAIVPACGEGDPAPGDVYAYTGRRRC